MSAPSDAAHPQALQSFARGVLALLDAWPALRIARDHLGAAPAAFDDARVHLAEELVDAYSSAAAPPPEADVADFLRRFFDGELDLSLEDASEHAVARDLARLWGTAVGPERELAIDQIRQRASRQSTSVQRADETRTETESEGESEGEDEDGSDDDDDGMDVGSAAATPGRPAPVVDDDGFTLVQRRR